MAESLEKQRNLVIETGKKLYCKGFCEGTSGNISCRVDGGYLVTCSGANLGELVHDNIVFVNSDGGYDENKCQKPTSEWLMHNSIYRKRPDVAAIVHTHPHYAIAVGVMGIGL